MSILNGLVLIRSYLQENMHNISLNVLSTIFIVFLISTTLISNSGIKTNYIKSELENLEAEKLNFSIDINANYDSDMINASLSNIQNTVKEIATTHELEQYISYEGCDSLSFQIDLQQIRLSSDTRVEYSTLEQDLLDRIAQSSSFEGRLPTHKHEVVLVTGNQEDLWIEVNTSIPFVLKDTEYHDYVQNMTVVGIYHTDLIMFNRKYRLSDEFIIKHPLMRLNSFYTTASLLIQNLEQFNDTQFQCDIRLEYALTNLGTLTFQNFQPIIQEINLFFQDFSQETINFNMERYVYKSQDQYYEFTQFTIITDFNYIFDKLEGLSILGMVGVLPCLTIAIFFSYYSTSSLFKKRKDQIVLLRMRGASTKQLISILLIESILSLGVSFLLGYGLGLVASGLILGNISQSTLIPLYLLDMSINTLIAVVLWTVTISGSLMIYNILIFIRIRVTEETTSSQHLQSSFWKKTNLDITLLLLGIFCTGILVMVQTYFHDIFYLLDASITQNVLLVLTLIFSPFPLVLLFGGILTLSRIIQPLINTVAKRFWNRTGNLFSYTMTLISRKKSALGPIILFILIFSMVFTLNTLPTFMETNAERGTYYNIGSDGFCKGEWNASLQNSLEQSAVIESVTPIGWFRYEEGDKELDFFIVNDHSFLETAYLESRFLKNSEEKITSLIQQENTTLVDKRGLEYLNMKLGQNISLTQRGEVRWLKLKLIGEFSAWPKLVPAMYSSYRVARVIPKVVISNATYHNLLVEGLIRFPIYTRTGYYLKTRENVSQHELKNFKTQFKDYQFEFVKLRMAVWRAGIDFQMINLQVTILNVITVLTTLITILLYFYQIIYGRARELVVTRSLGIKIKQISAMFIYETIIIMLFSFILGGILGFLFSTSFSTLLVLFNLYSASIPVVSIYIYPIAHIGVAYIGIVVIAVLVSVIPAILIRNFNIGVSLRKFY